MIRTWGAAVVFAAGLALLAACAPAAKPAAAPADPRLEALFSELKQAPDAAAAERVEAQIWALWADSGSPTVEILIERAGLAAARGDDALALRFVDEATRLRPDYAEGWRLKAQLAIKAEDYSAALNDVVRTLQREPRHFGALAQLGALYEGFGRDKAALAAYRAALAVHPHLEEARQGQLRLSPQVDGAAT